MTLPPLVEQLLTDLDRELAPGWAHRCLMGKPCPGCLRDRLRVRLATARVELAEAEHLAEAERAT
jgi:hypothetical protein